MQKIPRSTGLPIIGSLLGFLGNRPEYLLQQSIQCGSIFQLNLARIKVVVVSDPELVQDVLIRRKADFIKSERGRRVGRGFLGDSLLMSVGDYHARQRKMIQPAFHATRIHAYGEQMVDATESKMTEWADGATRDIHSDMMQLTMEIVAVTLFGNGVKDDAIKVGEAISVVQKNGSDLWRRLVQIPYWMRKDFYDREAQAKEILDHVIMRFITERRKQGTVDTGDLLSMLLLTEDEDGNRMTDEEVRYEAITLFAAGHETTSNALTWTWYLLSQYPEVEARLHQELDTVLAGRRPTIADLRNSPYTHQVLKEAMRLYPPAWTLMPRDAVRDTQLGGYEIPKGWSVFVSPYVLHRHPDLWDEPETFNPDRFAPENVDNIHRYQYFPFGAGEHVCIGNSFAMMEAALVLATIASQYTMTLEPSQNVIPDAMVTLMPRDGLKMQLHQRQDVLEPVL